MQGTSDIFAFCVYPVGDLAHAHEKSIFATDLQDIYTPKGLAKRAERLRLQDCKGMVRVGDGMMRPPLSAHYRRVNFVDKQYEALMSSPGPRPAETRVSDDISLCKLATGAPSLVVVGGSSFDVTK